ncbi:hypothetical protein ACFLWZ_04425 [Chloroflexota bacterium]
MIRTLREGIRTVFAAGRAARDMAEVISGCAGLYAQGEVMAMLWLMGCPKGLSKEKERKIHI